MTAIVKVCDRCGKELKGWEDNSGYLNIKFNKSCCNKLSSLPNNKTSSGQSSENIYEDFCTVCQMTVEKQLLEVLTTINNYKTIKEITKCTH